MVRRLYIYIHTRGSAILHPRCRMGFYIQPTNHNPTTSPPSFASTSRERRVRDLTGSAARRASGSCGVLAGKSSGGAQGARLRVARRTARVAAPRRPAKLWRLAGRPRLRQRVGARLRAVCRSGGRRACCTGRLRSREN